MADNPKQRTLSIIFLNHDHTMDFLDTGPGREGEPTTGRAQIQNVLKERTVVDGLPIPLAMLNPEVTPEILHQTDPMDLDFLRGDDGRWRYPTPEWMTERATRVQKAKDDAALFATQMQAKDADKMLRGLARIGEQNRGRGDKPAASP